jgi:hypothetical protein
VGVAGGDDAPGERGAGPRPEPSARTGEPPRAAERPARAGRPMPQPMPRLHVAILSGFVGLFYAVGMVARGAVAPGIVGGVLAAILCFLVMREVGRRQQRRIRERERAKAP